MKKSAKIGLALASVCVSGSLLGSVVFAAQTSGSSPSLAASSATLKTQLKTDRTAQKQLQSENKQLSQQIKADVQTWHTQNPNPMKQLTSTQLNSVKTLRSEIKNEEAALKPLRQQVHALYGQLKAARQAKDKTTVAQLRSQIEPLVSQIKSGNQQVKADRQQLQAILPPGVVKAFRAKQLALHKSLKDDWTALKGLNQQLRADEHTLKTDRQNKDWSQVNADLQKINADLQSTITAKQQLLKDFSSTTAETTQAAN